MNYFQSLKYVWDAIAAKVSKSGDTMSGQLTLPGGGTGSNADTVSDRNNALNTIGAPGDAGEVVIFDAAGKPVRGSEKTIVVDNYFATEGELITGADPRAGLRGGVSMDYGKYPIAGTTLTNFKANGDWTMSWMLRDLVASAAGEPHYGAAGVVSFGNSTNGIQLMSSDSSVSRFKVVQNVASVETVLATYTPTNYKGWITITSEAGLWKLYDSGTLVATASTTHTGAESLTALFTLFTDGGENAFRGKCREHYYINKTLTADEIIACNKGEIPAELARQAQVGAGQNDWVGEGTISGGSTTGAILSGGGGSYMQSSFTLSGGVKAGEKYRVTFTSTNTPAVSPQWVARTAILPLEGVQAPVNGINAMVFTAMSDDTGITFVVSGDNPSSWTISGISIERIGTVEHFAPDQVTSLGRWIGKFGADLIPSAGITPLDPQPIQERTATCAMNLGTSAVLNAGPAGWGTPSKAATGKISWPLPSYLPASAVVNISTMPSSEATAARSSMSGSNAIGETFQAGVATDDSNTRVTVIYKE